VKFVVLAAKTARSQPIRARRTGSELENLADA
jgi:hypothetical protein